MGLNIPGRVFSSIYKDSAASLALKQDCNCFEKTVARIEERPRPYGEKPWMRYIQAAGAEQLRPDFESCTGPGDHSDLTGAAMEDAWAPGAQRPHRSPPPGHLHRDPLPSPPLGAISISRKSFQ